MMGTELTYIQIGGIISFTLQVLAVAVILYRLLRCFENYVNTGNFGDPKKSWFGQIMEKGNFFSGYAFTGYHPIVLVDGFLFMFLGFTAMALWGVYAVAGLIILLARVMRKRIAHKQEFYAKLEGTNK